MRTSNNRSIKDWSSIRAGDYLNACLSDLAEIEQENVIFDRVGEMLRIKALFEAGVWYQFKSLGAIHNGFRDWYEQRMDFVPSNLKKGYVPYLICNKCDRRAVCLYYRAYPRDYSSQPLCRICCGLKY